MGEAEWSLPPPTDRPSYAGGTFKCDPSPSSLTFASPPILRINLSEVHTLSHTKLGSLPSSNLQARDRGQRSALQVAGGSPSSGNTIHRHALPHLDNGSSSTLCFPLPVIARSATAGMATPRPHHGFTIAQS